MKKAPETHPQQQAVVNVVCSHCKKQIKMRKPTRPGFYKVMCPHCEKTFAVKVANRVAEQADAQDRAVVSCPQCLHPIAFRPQHSGIYRLTCPNDQHVFVVRVSVPTDGCTVNEKKPEVNRGEFPEASPNSTQSDLSSEKNNDSVKMCNTQTESTHFIPKADQACDSEACLVLHHKLLRKLIFPLKEGNNFIGRPCDTDAPDIAIPNDTTISRRSINIEKTPSRSGNGSFYRLTVIKTTNPVYHNNQPLACGVSVFLNFGDKITLGKTVLSFEEVAK